MVDGMVGRQPFFTEGHLTSSLLVITGAHMRADSWVGQVVDEMVGLHPVFLDCHLTGSMGVIT